MIGILIVALAAGLILFFFIVAAGKKSGATGAVRADFDPHIVKTKWNEIQQQMNTPSGLKNALIEADKLLDYVLKGKGFQGTTMADRLKIAQSSLSNRESVWAAHKLRNTLVHEVAIDVVPVQVQRSVRDLGQAIRDLGVGL